MKEKPSARTIGATVGLPDNERIELLEKATRNGWTQRNIETTKEVLKNIELEAKKEILKPETHITPEAIKKIAELPKEAQKQVVVEARVRRLNEPDTLKMVERVKEGKQPQVDRTVNELQDVLEDFTKTHQHIKTWGINQYGIVGPSKWGQACEMFTKIEDHLKWLRRRGWEDN